MNCLLIAATAKEIAPFLQYYRNGDNKQDIDILITGIGSMATTYALTSQIRMKRPALVVQAGIAGSFDNNIALGSVVVVKQDTMADLGVMENKQLKTMFDLGLIKPGQPPFRNGWLMNPHREWLGKTRLRKVKAVSVNKVSTDKRVIAFYREKFEPVIESMEGAALHYVCLLEKIPFLQIRSISNYIGERDKKKWNLHDAVSRLNNELIKLSENFKP